MFRNADAAVRKAREAAHRAEQAPDAARAKAAAAARGGAAAEQAMAHAATAARLVNGNAFLARGAWERAWAAARA